MAPAGTGAEAFPSDKVPAITATPPPVCMRPLRRQIELLARAHSRATFPALLPDAFSYDVFLVLVDRLAHDADVPAQADLIARRQALLTAANTRVVPATEKSATFRAFHCLVKARKISVRALCDAHRLLYGQGSARGAFRDLRCHVRCRRTGIITYTAPAAMHVPSLVDDLLGFADGATSPSHVFVTFLQFLLIHPFADGNGRTARILLASLCWRNALAHPVMLMALQELYRTGEVRLLAGLWSASRQGDWTCYLAQCQQAIAISMTRWQQWLAAADADLLNRRAPEDAPRFLACVATLWSDNEPPAPTLNP